MESLRVIWHGAVGDKFGVARSLVRATPLVLCGLGIVVAWRAKMFNIGGEGQYIIGGVCGAWVGKGMAFLPPAALNVAIILGAVVGGAIYSGLAGYMQVKRGVHVVISTILLNFIALQILDYAVTGPLQERRHIYPMTDRLPNDAMLWRFDAQTDLHSGVFIALFAVVAVYGFMYFTKAGYRLRLAGESSRVARAARIRVPRVQMSAMLLSGGLAGLAGGVDYVGVIGQIGNGFPQNVGFLSIPVALLGGLHPVGTLVSGVFFGGLFAGSEDLAQFNLSGTTVVLMMQAAAVLAYVGIKSYLQRRKTVQEAL